VPSSRRTTDPRRKTFLNLSAQIEGQLRDAYDIKFQAGLINQSSLAAKLGVNRSAIHHRLLGHTNMTIETIADMVWGLGCVIDVKIYDPATAHGRNFAVTAPTQDIPTMGAANPTASPFTDPPTGNLQRILALAS
jgi:hypothetical protein